jgi:hypothetical protein
VVNDLKLVLVLMSSCAAAFFSLQVVRASASVDSSVWTSQWAPCGFWETCSLELTTPCSTWVAAALGLLMQQRDLTPVFQSPRLPCKGINVNPQVWEMQQLGTRCLMWAAAALGSCSSRA